MDPNQNQGAPPVPAGFEDEAPLTNSAQSAGIDSSQAAPPPPVPDGFVDEPPARKQSTLTLGPSDTFAHRAENVGKVGAGLLSGVGEGVFDTAAGAAGLINKATDSIATKNPDGSIKHVIPQSVVDYLHNLAGDNEEASNAEKIGYGGESLTEFILGDEALKGLSQAAKLQQAAKTMKVVEGSPAMVRALKIGTQVLRDAAETGVRGGVVQGAQTFVRSGGDVDKAAHDMVTNAALGTGLGAALGTAGEVASKYGLITKAANVIGSIGDNAKNALSEEGTFSGIGNAVRASRDAIDSIFQKAKTSADTETAAAEADRVKSVDKIDQSAASQTVGATTGQAVTEQAAHDALAVQTTKADNALEEAKQLINSTLVNRLGEHVVGNIAPEDAADLASDTVHGYQKKVSAAYQEGLTGQNGLETQLGKLDPLEYVGSNRQKAAQKEIKLPEPQDHVDTTDLNDIAGEKLSPKIRKFLEERTQGFKTTEAEGPVGKTDTATPQVKTPIPPATIHDLVEAAESAREAEAGAQWGSPDQRAMHRYRAGILDDIDAMAAKSQNPEAAAKYKALRETYKGQMADLSSPTAKKLDLTKPDKALNNMSGWLRNGQNSGAKLEVANRVLGPDIMKTLAATDMQSLREAAQDDPNKFIKMWGNIDDSAKQGFYGPETTDDVNKAIDEYRTGNQEAIQQHQQMLDDATEDHANKLNSSQIDTGIEHSQILGDQKAATQKATDTYNAAVQATQAKLDQAATAQGIDSAKYKGGFMEKLAEGRANEALSNGTVDLQDVRNVKAAAGDHWDDIRNNLFQRGMIDGYDSAGKAIPKTPEQVLDWWDKMQPDVRSEMFSTNDPASIQKYNDVMDSIRDAASTKRLVRNGMLTLAHVATSLPGIAIGALAHNAIGSGLSELIGGVVSSSLGTTPAGKRFVAEIVDKVANNPNTWKTLGALGKAAKPVESVAKAGAANAGRIIKGVQSVSGKDDAKKNIYGATAGALK